MVGINEHEYADAMNDYLQWYDELERLKKLDEPDEDEISYAENIVKEYEEILFG